MIGVTVPKYVYNRSGKVLLDNQPPPKEDEEEKHESEPKAIPPFPERLTRTTQPTLEETELLGELKQLCVNIPLLQAIRMCLYTTRLSKRSVSGIHVGAREMPQSSMP